MEHDLFITLRTASPAIGVLLVVAAVAIAGAGSRAALRLSLRLVAPTGAALPFGLGRSGPSSVVTRLAAELAPRLRPHARRVRRVGDYALGDVIGSGASGVVYRARRTGSTVPAALKVVANNGSAQQRERFEREVRLTTRLRHPNTITIFDHGCTADGTSYYAMELLDGLTLEELVERHGPLPAGRVIFILLQICAALDEAHRTGLVHRDVKPANLYLCGHGQPADFVKVLDFGLVREIGIDADAAATNADTLLGTPLYLSPEAILRPGDLDARADIYGLGGVAYFLATGVPPFRGRGVVEVCAHHLHTTPTPPSTLASVPPDLEQVILSCLAKDAAARPQSARALARALRACESSDSWSESDAESWWQRQAQAA